MGYVITFLIIAAAGAAAYYFNRKHGHSVPSDTTDIEPPNDRGDKR